MNTLILLVAHTANLLGSFNDPFEFDGDYGPELNPIREKVFELVISKEAQAKNLSNEQIKELLHDNDANEITVRRYRQLLTAQASLKDQLYGPTLSEIVPPELLQALLEKQNALQINPQDITNIVSFVKRFGNRKVFYFLRNNPSALLKLDYTLRFKAASEGHAFELPILSSTHPLEGSNLDELKENLLNGLFNESTLALTESEADLKVRIDKLERGIAQNLLGPGATNRDLYAFCSPAGQIFFYWLYQSLNLHLLANDWSTIAEINKVKEVFRNTFGDPKVRAADFKNKFLAANSSVIFTQEADPFVMEELTKDNLFLSIDKQNTRDGTLVFLRSDLWEADYQVIPLVEYEKHQEGSVNLILATHSPTHTKFLLASAHGNSTNAEDGRNQIKLITQKYHQLRNHPENEGLQLLIGIDANTKNENDVELLREHLDSLGLIGTSVGATTVKRRMVTAQHSKAYRFAKDQEDYLITLKPEYGGKFNLSNPTVGFKESSPDLNIPLPNIHNLSDHYPIGVTLN